MLRGFTTICTGGWTAVTDIISGFPRIFFGITRVPVDDDVLVAGLDPYTKSRELIVKHRFSPLTCS